MDVIVTASTGTSSALILPISFIFWCYVAAYTVHILEEAVLGETFVAKVKGRVWPGYNWRKFFGFNTLLMSLNIIAIILYEIFGGAWIVFPLSLAFERIFNGFWHLGETIVTRKFSSGLLSSILFWILGYFIVRYSFLKGEIPVPFFIISMTMGLILTCLMFGSLMAFKKKYMPESNSH